MNLTKTLKQRKMNKVLLTLLQALLVFNQTTFKYPTMTLTMFCKHASYIPMYRTRLWFKCVVLHKIVCLSSVCAYVSQRDIFVKLFIVKRTGIWHRFLVIFFYIWCNIIVKLSVNYPIDNITTNAKPEGNETTNIL